MHPIGRINKHTSDIRDNKRFTDDDEEIADKRKNIVDEKGLPDKRRNTDKFTTLPYYLPENVVKFLDPTSIAKIKTVHSRFKNMTPNVDSVTIAEDVKDEQLQNILSGFNFIDNLVIKSSHITTLYPLRSHHIKRLIICSSSSNIDMSTLQSLKHLTELTIDHCKVDMYVMLEMNNLQKLSLSYNSDQFNEDEIYFPPNLTYLSIHAPFFHNTSMFIILSKLQTLKMKLSSYDTIHNLETLVRLENLKYLSIDVPVFKNVNRLNRLIYLETLKINSAVIGELNRFNIDNLKKLKYLSINAPQFNYESLVTLVDLKRLKITTDCLYNDFGNIIYNLPKLRELSINANFVFECKWIHKHQNLEFIRFNKCTLIDTLYFKNMDKLKLIIIRNCRIDSYPYVWTNYAPITASNILKTTFTNNTNNNIIQVIICGKLNKHIIEGPITREMINGKVHFHMS